MKNESPKVKKLPKMEKLRPIWSHCQQRRLRARVARWHTYFQTKNPNLGKFWRVLQWEMLAYIFYGDLVYFTALWFILR
jgi:hypothetical protein